MSKQIKCHILSYVCVYCVCVLLEGSNNLGLEGVAKCNRRHFCSEMKIKKNKKIKTKLKPIATYILKPIQWAQKKTFLYFWRIWMNIIYNKKYVTIITIIMCNI